MSTTSLSSCGRSEYDWSKCNCVYEDSYGRAHPGLLGPFYNTMGQPLVYYSQVQPQNFRPSERKRKENKNCFAKAFKWYTQDFNQAPKQASPVSPDLTGFATWLDTKYGEYLRESDTQQVCQRAPPQSSRVSTTDTTTCPPSQTTTTRRFPRLRSPWNKRKSACRQAEAVPCKSKSPNASCQFILQPQDLNRPVSEYCYQSQTTCPNKSETVVISIEALGTKKSAVKSRSMTSICSENIPRNQIDVITVQEGPKSKEAHKFMTPCDQKCKVNKKIQELPQLTPSQSKLQTLCEKNCPTKEECLIYEEMLQQSLAQSQIPYDQRKQCQIAQEAQFQMKNAPSDQTNTNKEMRELPGYSVLEKTCDQICAENQRSSLVQNYNNRQEYKVRIDTEANTPARQYGNTLCNQNTEVKPPCATAMLPAKSENLERTCDPTCRYYNIEEIKAPQASAPVFPSEPGRQLNKKGAKATKMPSKGKRMTDNECQCPEEKPFVEQSSQRQLNKKGAKGTKVPSKDKRMTDNECQWSEEKPFVEQSYPCQVAKEPRSIDSPPCKCFITEQMPLLVQVPQVPFTPNPCRPGKLKMEQISSTRGQTNTTFDQNIPTQQKSVECMIPDKTEDVGLLCGQSCPVKYTNNDVEEIQTPTQTRGTMFPCELSSEKQVTQQQKQFNTRANMKNVSSKRLSRNNDCQCPEEKPVSPPGQCIELERISPAPLQAKPIQRAIQPYPQNKSTSGDSENIFTKISQKSTGNVCCGCSETNDLPCGTCCPKSACVEAKTKSVNVSQYPSKINLINVNVSCQCSENDFKQVKTRSFISYIPKEKKIMMDVSCQCSEENVLQYVTPSQYRRNDFENCDATCVNRKLVRSAGPPCPQGTDSFVVKNTLQVRKLSQTSAMLKSDSVQTSDHSISLEKEDYALFLKIVCADKLNDGSCGENCWTRQP